MNLSVTAMVAIGLASTPVVSACAESEPTEQSAMSATSLAPEVSPSEAQNLQDKGALLIDVRTPEEWEQTGIPADAHTITLQDADFLKQVERLTGGDKDQPVAFICRSGNRSAKARDRLVQEGYTNVTSVAGGVAGEEGWIAEDLPVREYP
ncbi:rhodanese-like domain-containing protein [Henriciella sp.]|uniref:rhodanese-like domain-containing protein n=1 Tax=Henriciella sp. TaxID=1968823 RepID=UPI002604880D|nr:rhodanese-like domain-containing protein [Henriciella sp.]